MRHIEDITHEPKDRNDPNNLISKTSINIDSLQNTEILNQTQVIPENGITDIKISNNLIPHELNFAIAVQSILKAFNLPYIISPMEADSQCAYLNINNIVDGVITEDNDVLIYGANKVYRNFFKKNKVPTCYSLQNIQSKLNLNQLDLIKLCYLLGSDYNIGQKGFGIVKSLQAIKNNEVADSSIEFLKNIYLNSNVTEVKEYEIFPTNKISRKNDIIIKVKKVLNENYVDEQNINEIIKLIVKIL
ncbi:XPGI-like DNA repair protein [Hamiltosporidium tvaerminnensis]|uniref:XPGI-like DNA repair protein n=1 Tax=Hamiltosporidium tvaerminnensis TaxID=1176355 RepID=A0A4Q9LM98_9MICR|nr:XPGI-like DNA repair protein [Hamiltosporidium tvaerminnensis]